MRFRDGFSFALIGLLPLVLYWAGIFDDWKVGSRLDQINRNDARRRAAIPLSSDRWVEFQIPRQATHLRVLANASVLSLEVPPPTQEDPRIGWRYSVEYELVDSAGQVVESADYHFRSRVVEVVDPDTGELIQPIWVGQTSRPATQTRVILLALRGERQEATRIRLRRKAVDRNVDEVLARVTARTERPDYADRATWNRLSPERREELIRYCVYDDYLLSPPERSSLLRWQWIHAAPAGVYPVRHLFFIGDRANRPQPAQAPPTGRLANRQWKRTLPLPPTNGNLHLRFQYLDETTRGKVPTRIRWFGQHVTERQSWEVDDDQEDFDVRLSGGLVEIEPARMMAVRAFWSPMPEANESAPPESQGEFEITPRGDAIQTFLVDHRPIEFHVTHVQGQSTPLRLSLRQIFDSMFSGAADPFDSKTDLDSQLVNWQFLCQGKIIQQGMVRVEPTVSVYDYVWAAGEPRLVSDVSTWYFHVPPEVDQVRLVTDGTPILINGAVRPDGLPRTVRIPEDDSTDDPNRGKERVWFAIKPTQYEQRIRDNRAVILFAQSRPPRTDPQILRGEYTWHRFVPDTRWIGRELLVPIDPTTAVRTEPSESTFAELEPGITYEYRRADQPSSWKAVASSAPVSSEPLTLMWTGEKTSPGMTRLTVDGRILFADELNGLRGRIKIPIDSTSENDVGKLVLTTERPTRMFLRGITLRQTPLWRKRTAQRLDQGTLRFNYEKRTSGQEIVTLMLFPQAGDNDASDQTVDRCQVKLHIEPPQPIVRHSRPTTDWTVLDRIYDIRAIETDSAWVFDTGQSVGKGYKCYIYLNEDLPPGQYAVTVDVDSASASVYALLYQTLPGTRPQREYQVRKAAKP